MGLLLLLAVVVVHNAFSYPPVSGIDAEEHIAYARMLVEKWHIPTSADLRNYYTPPGFFLVAGAAVELGDRLGVTEPDRFGQLLNGILTVATGVLTAILCGIVFPGRPWLRCRRARPLRLLAGGAEDGRDVPPPAARCVPDGSSRSCSRAA